MFQGEPGESTRNRKCGGVPGRGTGRTAARTTRASTDMDLRLTRPRAPRGGRRGGGVYMRGARARARGGDRWLGGARGGEPARGVSPPRDRVRAVVACRSAVVRRTGVCERAECGGGEPRAARARADGRARSAPPLPAGPAPRRARSLPGRPRRREPAPRLRPVFLWARQTDGTVQEVRCEDYDSRNRIRIARTANGWRVIPRTEIYNSIRISPPPPRERRERRRRRRYGKSKRRRVPSEQKRTAWIPPDVESHIPSHTIAVPRAPSPPPRVPSPPRVSSPPRAPSPLQAPSPPQVPSPPRAPSPLPEPTPLDNLLAVAELEFNQQRGAGLLSLEGGALHAFLPDEDRARDVMSFELGDSKPADDMFFDSKAHEEAARGEEPPFPADIGAHKDLFETISEAHYLPELSGPADEALLDSLVEKGCEDNQILGQALDKLAHLVHGAPDYNEDEDDMLLGAAPVADIIHRLEAELGSPRSSMSAAHGLLTLHHPPSPPYPQDHVFAQRPPDRCAMDSLNSHADSAEINHVEYDSAEKRLEGGADAARVMYTESVPDTHEAYDKQFEEHPPLTLPDRIESLAPSEAPSNNGPSAEISETSDVKIENSQMESNDQEAEAPVETLDIKKETNNETQPTDLSVKHVEQAILSEVLASVTETANAIEDNMSEKSDEQPRDLSVHRRLPTPHASPRRTDVPRAPSRESDAMQSPQPSGIPAVPSSPEIFTMPLTKSKQTLFLETLLSSPSPKMYTSEVTITKQQCEPLNLGKHRKSASPTVSSCSDEIRKVNKEYGEPNEKRIKRESTEDLVKISKVFSNKCSEDVSESKQKKSEKPNNKSSDETSPLKQLQILKTSSDFNIPDPLLVPKDKLNIILANPGREIPTLLIQRPELRLPDAFAYPSILQDPDILVISLSQLESILENDAKKLSSPKLKEPKSAPPKVASSTEHTSRSTPQAETTTTTTTTTSQPKPIPSMDALAGDIDAATSAALNQMLWLPYLSQLEAMAACSQNMDFLKALNSSGYNGPNYPDLSQMFNPSGRFPMGPSGFPMMPQMDYENRLQFAMWQEAMNQANASASQRSKQASNLEAQMKELASKSSDVQNPYVHSTKNHQSKPHSSARTSPIAHNYNNNQRSMNHNPFLQGMYPGMNPNIRPNMPLPGLQIPYFNPNMMGSQRSPRTGQQKSPTSPYYQNNNYLQSVKQSEGQIHHQRSNSTSSQDSPRPRISVKSLQNLLEPSAAAATNVRRNSSSSSSMGRRREEPEVGSTTPLGEPQPHLPPHPHPHDPSSFHLWHPLFGNQKGYASPWSWTQVTATGD